MGNAIRSRLLYQQTYQALLPAIQDERECQAITQQLLEHYYELGAVQIVLDEPTTHPPAQGKLLSVAISRLKKQDF